MEIEDPAKPQPTRFVLLRHTMPANEKRESHWDLMIEGVASLLTFELKTLPKLNPPGSEIRQWVTRLPDHRLEYLTYEGALSHGRGSVVRVTGGTAQRTGEKHSESMHYALNSPELEAILEIEPCAAHQSTQLRIHRWQWLTENAHEGRPRTGS